MRNQVSDSMSWYRNADWLPRLRAQRQLTYPTHRNPNHTSESVKASEVCLCDWILRIVSLENREYVQVEKRVRVIQIVDVRERSIDLVGSCARSIWVVDRRICCVKPAWCSSSSPLLLPGSGLNSSGRASSPASYCVD